MVIRLYRHAPALTPLNRVSDPAGRVGFQFNDGGRAAAGYRGKRSDCVVRAIAIAHFGADQIQWVCASGRLTQSATAYNAAYDLLKAAAKKERARTRKCRKSGERRVVAKSSISTGVWNPTTRRILTDLGWKWNPTMGIGGGCTTHLRADELPSGRLIVAVSRHVCAVIDGIVHDTHCDDRDGTRCVYGFWSKP